MPTYEYECRESNYQFESFQFGVTQDDFPEQA